MLVYGTVRTYEASCKLLQQEPENIQFQLRYFHCIVVINIMNGLSQLMSLPWELYYCLV